jgi:hypothetical protein
VIQRIASVPKEVADRERALQVLGDLAGGNRPAAAAGQRGERREGEQPHTMLPAEDEQFVIALKAGLARLAESWRNETADVATAVNKALDSAEFLTRCQLLGGQSAQVPQLLPSFVYLVLSPPLGRPEALSVATRSAQLLRHS